jgi:hypothetical protein
MGVSWNDDKGPSGLPGSGPRPLTALFPPGPPGSPARLAGSLDQQRHSHRRRRRPALLARPQAAAAAITTLLAPDRVPGGPAVPRRAFRRYWV